MRTTPSSPRRAPGALVVLLLALTGACARTSPATRLDAPPAVLRIYLARHGETDWNKEKRLQGTVDTPLNEVGRAQARKLGERLAGLPLDAIYCSALSRSRETATLVGRGAPISLPGLNERNHGRFQGVLLEGSDPDTTAFHRRKSLPDDDLDGGESPNAFYARVEGTVRDIVARHPGGNILIVGHGYTNAQILRALLHLSPEDAERIRQANDTLLLIEVPAQGPVRVWKNIQAARVTDI